MAATDRARPFIVIRPWLRAGLLRHLSPTASRILFLLVDHCGTDGYSYPSARTLASESGHTPKTIYVALHELVIIGCIQRAGRTRFNTGHRHPGPVYYAISEFDNQAAARLRLLESKKKKRGDKARFTPKIFPTQEHHSEGKMFPNQEYLNPTRCSSEHPHDVPIPTSQDIPESDRQDVPGSGRFRAFGSEPSDQSLLQSTPPSPPTGGTAIPKKNLGIAAHAPSHGSGGNGNGKRATKAVDRMREDVRLFLEREATMGDGLKSLDHWQRWFPKTYEPAMVAEVFHEVQRAHPKARLP